MDINNISGNLGSKLNSVDSADRNKPAADISVRKNGEQVSDKVSISSYGANKGEELFAKIEMEKLNQSSFDKLKTMKAKISEYEAAKEVSGEAAENTEIGKLLNNPDVWGEIANKMLD